MNKIYVEKGDIFGWGNSEYDQLAIAKPQATQVCHPTWLNFKDIGKIIKSASAGSMCILLNGMYCCLNVHLIENYLKFSNIIFVYAK